MSVEGVLLEEHIEDLGLVHAERAQDDRHRQLAAAVDAREHAVLGIEFEVEPGAAVRNDARGEQQLARGMGLAAVVIEEHARRAVQLADDDALGAVDDEGAVVGHQRQLAEVDLLLAHVLDRLLGAGGFLVIDNEAHFHAQRRRVGQPAQLAFLDVEHRLAEPIVDVFEDGVARIARDRKHALECRVQAGAQARIFSRFRLQKAAVGIELNRQQIRHLEDALLFAEILSEALLFSERVGHRVILAIQERARGKTPPANSRQRSRARYALEVSRSITPRVPRRTMEVI